MFNDFCSEQKTPVDLATCSPRDLDETLSNFYVGIRKKDGGLYMRASYLAARASVSRYMVQTLQRPDCNLYRQPEFRRSNMVLDGVLKEKKRSGCEPQVEHKDSIAASDLAKIMSYFENILESGDAVKLAQYCWFNLSLHFALRGAEVQLKLSKSDIVFAWTATVRSTLPFLATSCQRIVREEFKDASSRRAGAFKSLVRWQLFENCLASFIRRWNGSFSEHCKVTNLKRRRLGSCDRLSVTRLSETCSRVCARRRVWNGATPTIA